MTEDEWLTSGDLAALLRWDTIRQRKRKLRLYSCGCARQLEPWFYSPRQLKALDASERYADDLIKDAGIGKWNAETNHIWREVQNKRVRDKASKFAASWAVAYSCMAEKYRGYQDITARVLEIDRAFGEKRPELLESFPSLLRDVFGNPFQPVTFKKAWKTSAAIALAQQMYRSRDFTGMPVLADALQEAGCDNDAILSHCRGDGPHVRGCWVVDGVLGKA